jgi:hypothetical protein
MAYRANGSLRGYGGASTGLELHPLQAQERGDQTASGMGQADRPGPTGLGLFQLGSVAPSRTWFLLTFCTLPLQLHHFYDVILTSKIEDLHA